MSQTVDTLQQQTGESHMSQVRPQPSFHYQMVDMKARKIATLIKISKLPYVLEEVTEIESQKYVLKTGQGELTNEYEIIGYIVNDNFMRNSKSVDLSEASQERPGIEIDIYSWSRINQKIYELRRTLFPLLDQFYRYVQGHEIVKQIKYKNLQNKIRKELHKLDEEIGQHSQIFGVDFSYINIILACELFFCYRLVFEEKFRKSKVRLFSLCEKIYNTSQFQDVYGKKRPCMKEYQPVQFQPQGEVESKKEQAIQIQLAKIAEPWVSSSTNQMRNQLLYNFFRNVFKGQESKMNYFPYFWMMYDNLICNLVQIGYQNGEGAENFSDLEKAVDIGVQDIAKIIKTQVDYGFLGLYFNQKQRQYKLQGLICLAESSLQELTAEMIKQTSLKNFKASKLDIANEEQRSKVEMLWQHQTQGQAFEGIKLSMLREF